MSDYDSLLRRRDELQEELRDILEQIRARQEGQLAASPIPDGGQERQPATPASKPSAALPAPKPRRRYSARDVVIRVAGVAILFCTVEAIGFHSNYYPSLLKPESTTGQLQVNLQLEKSRKMVGRNQVLAVGDSRMGLLPHVTDRLALETGYTLANIATPGTDARCWYYMFRDVDPDRNRYAAVLIQVNELEDDDWGDLSSAEVDQHYLVPLLRVSDAYDFTRSFPTWKLRWRALRTIFLKGLTYSLDFQDMLAGYSARSKGLRWVREEMRRARYNYEGPKDDVTGLQVDWAAHKITEYPPGATAGQRHEFDQTIMRPVANYTGARAVYRRLWFGRIIDYYRGSRTRVVFLRIPRGPVVRPYPFSTKSSTVRQFVARGQALLMDEHSFDELERPEMFMDPVHLNGLGCARFSEVMSRAVRTVLGPPNPGS